MATRRAIAAGIGLVAANVFAYGSVVRHGFVNWDDDGYVTANPFVAHGLTATGFRWAFTTRLAGSWHPLTWLSHMLDVQLYGMNAGGHHLTSLLLHIAGTLVLFVALARMTGALGRSAFVAALFAVHPLHVESVAWVAERKDVLSGLFGLLALWGYAEYARAPRPLHYLGVVVPFALGLMAKPMLVSLPFVLLLLDVWPLRRWPTAVTAAVTSPAPESRAAVATRLILEKLPLLLLALAASIAAFLTQRRVGALIGLDAIPIGLRLANPFVAYVAYVRDLLWPARLGTLYPYPASLPPWGVAAAVVAIVAASVLAVRLARRHAYVPVGWFWYLGTLAPVIGWIQVGLQARADRYTYLPLIGLFIVAAWGIPDLLRRWPRSPAALPAAAMAAIMVLVLVSRQQASYWRNSVALWRHTLAVTADNPVAHTNLGSALERDGLDGAAAGHFTEALRLWSAPAGANARTLDVRPVADAHNNLGVVLAKQGRFDEAIAHYAQALRLVPEFAEAHNNLGGGLAAQGRFAEAAAEYAEAVRIRPDYASAQNNLGLALVNQGRVADAIPHYAEAIRIAPAYAPAHYNLGAALAGQGRVTEAIAEFSEAIRLQPDYAEAHNDLGTALASQGRLREAMEHFGQALRIRPGFAQARSNWEYARELLDRR